MVLLWLSVCGNAFGKAQPIFRNFVTENTNVKKLTACSAIFALKATDKQYCRKFVKAEEVSSLVSKGMRRKAVPLDTDLLPDFYNSEFVTLRCFHDTVIYGLTVLYSVSRHTYLHLYQLF